jgi:hypothetical protein
MKRIFRDWAAFLSAGVLLAGCSGIPAGEKNSGPPYTLAAELTASPLASETNTPFLPSTESRSPDAEQTSPAPADALLTVWLSPLLPSSFRDSLPIIKGWAAATAPEDADVRLQVGNDHPISTWTYVLAAPFPTVTDGVTGMELRAAWSGAQTGWFAGRPLLLDENTLAVFSGIWGDPAPGATRVVAAEDLLDTAWDDRPSWAILPWEELEPRWKVLTVDGQSPLQKEFDPALFPLNVPISCIGEPALCDQALAAKIPSANRDPSKLTTLILTGVTALVRATAFTMEARGITYPAQDVGPLLRSADLTHISNEIPFARDCPPPDPSPGMYKFCSDPRYIGLLEYVGTDIVEMTGNHVLDWKVPALLYTLDLYRQRGWAYYASGENLAAARQPVLLEHNGNRLAFIGCNRPGYNGEWATETTPGSAPCDFDYLQTEIRRLRADGYLPVMTFQYFEYYRYEPTEEQAEEFGLVADAGAVIVSGSQAHFPQGFAFSGKTLIHYGLGNLFFDQYGFDYGTEIAFIDRHVFYGGRYLGVELFTIRFVDYARPRFMTPQERSDLLSAAFAASGW